MWYYQTQEGNAGQNKRPGRLKDLEDHSIKSLVREVIQNSLDVKMKHSPFVKLKFHIGQWEKEQNESFLKKFTRLPIETFKESFEEAQEDTKVKMLQGVEVSKNISTPSFYLVIEEEYCLGLTGSVNGYEGKTAKPSNFNSLMRMVDDNEKKKENPNSGGTWGKGSSVFTFSSALWLWFSYSELSEPWTDAKTGVVHSKRFMGRCAISPFYNIETEKTLLGEGWFCNNGKEVYPYINEEADNFADALGIKKRNKNFGTTFFIPFFNPFNENATLDTIIEELRSQILSNWFIPIYQKQLVVELDKVGANTLLDREYLQLVPELKFKLDLLNWYHGLIPKNKNFIIETFNVKAPKLKPAFKRHNNQFAMTKHDAKVDLLIRLIDEDEDFENNWGTENKIALTRNKGMIINHYNPFDTTEIRYESILLTGLLTKNELNEDAKRHLDLFLAYCENPSHNKWCYTKEDYPICFLDRFDGKSPKPETLLYNMFNELGKIIRRFVVKEKVSNTSKDICDIFKRLTKLRNLGSETTGKSLFFMRRMANPEIDAEGRFVFRYRLISNTDLDEIEINFKSKIKSLEGEREKDFEILGIKNFEDIEILDEESQVLSSGKDTRILLKAHEEMILIIRTCDISGNSSFNNIEPIIKATAKILSHE